MSSINDENELKKCLDEMIELIEETQIEESSYEDNNNDKQYSNKLILEKLTKTIAEKLKTTLNLLSIQFRSYFLNLFQNYNYSFDHGQFKETLKKYIIKQLINDLKAIRDSFQAFQAAFNGNLSIVQEFIQNYPSYKDISGIYGTTLLYSSSRNNHKDIVKYLIEKGKCFVNIQNKEHYSSNNQINPTSGSTPLHAAAFYGHLDILKFLIDHDGDYFIENDLKETPIFNGLYRENIKLFFQDYLICSYTNRNNHLPQSTLSNDYSIINDSLWEYKALDSDQWILFDQHQSNQLQQSLLNHQNPNFNQQFLLNINNKPYSTSIVKFVSFDLSNQQHFWIRSRAFALLNFNFYSKWQIYFEKASSTKTNSKSSLDVFNIDQNADSQLKIQFNHWYNANTFLNQHLDQANNYRKKLLSLHLPFLNNQLFLFNFKTYSFHNSDKTFQGYIRWIPFFISNYDQNIIDNFQADHYSDLIPKYRINQSTTTTTTTTNQFQSSANGNDGNGNEDVSLDVRFGDLINEKVDVIVVSWSSKYLLELIYDCGGPSIRGAVNHQLEKNLKNSLTSVQSDGDIKAKRIYFLYWQIETQIDLVKKSLENFISIAMQKAHDDKFKTIAFPAIGCGNYNYSTDIVAQTMVNKAHQEQILHKISVSFIIQPTKKDIFQHFDKQIKLLNSANSSDFVSTNIQNSLIQIEKGDITKQKVDVIVVSSSSETLSQIVLAEGGENVYECYKKEMDSNPNSLLITTPGGNLSCKKIFFLKWEPDENETKLRQSISDFISNVIQNVLSYRYDSIAFPSIGSGHSNISNNLIIKTLISQLVYQIKNRDLSLTIKFIILPDQHQIFQQFSKELLTVDQDNETSIDELIPSTWETSAGGATASASASNQYRFLVAYKSHEYKTIEDEFRRSMKGKLKSIIKIERIQNERWYFQYLAHKKDFLKRLNKNTEQRLYHGCPEHVQNSIIEDCFNRSFAGVNGTSYGIGVYFSTDATYSNQFAKPNSNGEKSMFIARVLVGNTTLGNPSMKTRPPGFDTTTDGKHIFVTYHDAQAYAEYLIIYK